MKNKIFAIIIVIALLVIGLLSYNAIIQKGPNDSELTIYSKNLDSYHFTRIVSLDPAATAMLYGLGAYKYLVGGNVYDCYPQVYNLPNVTDYPSMDIEEIVNLSPQLVIGCYNYTGAQISQLNSLGIHFMYLNSGTGTNMSVIEQQTTALGMITGTEKNATLINAWMNNSIQVFNSLNITNTYTMFYALYPGSHGTWTAGNNTFMNQMFTLAHLKNIAINQSGFYEISNEVVLNSTPEVLLLDQYFNKSLVNNIPFDQTPAYKNNRIYSIFNDNFFQQPDFRDIYGIKWLIKTIYNINVTLPAFPINLQYPPYPLCCE